METIFVDFSDIKNDDELTIDEICNLKDNNKKSELFEKRLDEIFHDWCKKNNVKCKILDTDSQYKMLEILCGQNSPYIFDNILMGAFGEDFPKVALCAKYADKLFRHVETFAVTPEDKRWRYIHAIAPHILDIWNCKYDLPVFLCYWKDFGDFVKCPSDTDRLYNIFKRVTSETTQRRY